METSKSSSNRPISHDYIWSFPNQNKSGKIIYFVHDGYRTNKCPRFVKVSSRSLWMAVDFHASEPIRAKRFASPLPKVSTMRTLSRKHFRRRKMGTCIQGNIFAFRKALLFEKNLVYLCFLKPISTILHSS